MKLYSGDIHVDIKDDRSPVTAADRASHAIITDSLSLTGLPILSEEGNEVPYDERRSWERYWLVDPLDGTREYLSRNGEFTVNIALMEANRPAAGVIYAPATDMLYAGDVASRKFYVIQDASRVRPEAIARLEDFSARPATLQPDGLLRVLVSRSHNSPEANAFIDALRKKGNEIALISAGSSLKFCLVAEGKADVYPRFGRTMEWDVAAGHAILLAVGKDVRAYPGDSDFPYNKPDLGNGWFIAR